MTQVIIQPAPIASAREHYVNTIQNLVDLDRHRKVLGRDFSVLRGLFPSGSAALWGVTPGATGLNTSKWARAEVGALVLFTGENRAYSSGVLVHKFDNPALARELWDVDANGLTWEHMYALDDIVSIDVPYWVLNAAAGYKPRNPFQGFLVLDPEQSQRVVSAMGTVGLSATSSPHFSAGGAPSSPRGGRYRRAKEKAASKPTNPFIKDPNKVDRGLIGHATTQNALADYARKKGWTPKSPSGAPDYDVAWNVGKTTFVAEVKSMTAANEAGQVRLAIGQVLDYQQMLGSRGRPVRPVIALEKQPLDTRWEAICSRHGITLVWPEIFARLDAAAASAS